MNDKSALPPTHGSQNSTKQGTHGTKTDENNKVWNQNALGSLLFVYSPTSTMTTSFLGLTTWISGKSSGVPATTSIWKLNQETEKKESTTLYIKIQQYLCCCGKDRYQDLVKTRVILPKQMKNWRHYRSCWGFCQSFVCPTWNNGRPCLYVSSLFVRLSGLRSQAYMSEIFSPLEETQTGTVTGIKRCVWHKINHQNNAETRWPLHFWEFMLTWR